jgi:hypothetical protein
LEVSWQLSVFAALTVTGLLVVNLRARKAAKT